MIGPFPVLVGDIGGTNARFALVGADGEAHRFDPVRLADHPTIVDAVRSVCGAGGRQPASMLLAIATPLFGETFRLTNADWTIDPAELIAEFGLGEVGLMNDFAAQGLAALALSPQDMAPIGGGSVVDGDPKVVIGPGTGLGIANVIRVGGRWAVIPGEGGHVDLGPRTPREMAIWPHLGKEDGRMSAELAISGRGLENLYRAIFAADGASAGNVGASEISRLALEAGDKPAGEAVALFASLLARLAGDMALLTLARGGIYIAGGIAAKLLPVLQTPQFRAEFEDKAPHKAIMRTIPLQVMTHPFAALQGLVACVREPQRFELGGASRRFSR
jgi:glucokinase